MTIYKKIKTPPKKLNIELFIFVFSIIFAPKIGLLDLKVIVEFVFLSLSIARNQSINFEKRNLPLVLLLFFIIILFLVSSVNNAHLQYAILFRYLRCLFSLFVIMIYVKSREIEIDTLMNVLVIVLLIHAIMIIISIILPNFEHYLYFISQYNKKFLRYRSTGLLSGYDYAGYYTNIGFVLSIVRNVMKKKNLINISALLFAIATVFTSRINTIILFVTVVLVIIYSLKKNNASLSMSVFFLIPILVMGSMFTILTISSFNSLKFRLIQNYEIVYQLNKVVNETYSDNVLENSIESQYKIDKGMNIFLGKGEKARTDPGIINTIYEIGLIGLALKMSYYLYMTYIVLKIKYEKYYSWFLLYVIILTSIFELKLIFYFSTGTFELITLLFMCYCAKDLQKKQSNYILI